MRIVRSLVLAVSLFLAIPAIAQAPVPALVEYNVAGCGGQDFTVIHVVLDAGKKTITFGDFLTSPTDVKKENDPLVFSYEEQPKDEDGIIEFKGTATIDKSKLELAGARRGNRIIGILFVDGELGHLYYGYVGPESDIVANVLDSYQACVDLRQMPREDMPKALVLFLTGGSTKLDTSSKS